MRWLLLNFCDDRNKALRNKKECISKADKIIRQTNDLNKQCSEYKTRLAEVINENTALTRKYKRLEKENEQLRNALQKAVHSAQAEENEGEDDEESDEIIRKMRQLYEAEQTLFIWAKRNFPPVLLRIILMKTSLKRRFVTAIFIR